MRTRFAMAFAAIAFSVTVGALSAPTAAATPANLEPAPAGLQLTCIGISLGSAVVPICF